MKESVWPSVIPLVCQEQDDYGRITEKNGKRVLVEFVSANPTGPLSVGHGRQAVLGDAIARLLENTGYDVEREYYYNDAGRQMRVLGESARARYLEELGLPFEFPEDGYQGEYIREIARSLVSEYGDSLRDTEDVTPFKKQAEKEIFADIDQTLKRFAKHTLLEVHPLTGRTHQIRVHLAFLQCPIVGDTIYGWHKSSLPINRHFLHAHSLSIIIPGEIIPRTFKADVPEELENIINLIS